MCQGLRWSSQPTTVSLKDKLISLCRFALAELNLAVVTGFRRFGLALYETTRERDVDYVGDGFLGAHHPDSLGVRIKVVGVRT